MRFITSALLMLVLSNTAYAFNVEDEYKSFGIVLGAQKTRANLCGPHSKIISEEANAQGKYSLVKCRPATNAIESMTLIHLSNIPMQIVVKYKESLMPEAKKVEFGGGRVSDDQAYDANMGGRIVKGGIPSKTGAPMDYLNLSGVMSFGNENSKMMTIVFTNCVTEYAQTYAAGQAETCAEVRRKLH